ncbi:ECs1072 family phage-associated protein [Serratia liquefaciens]|uniref:ECs1072 family phage-associated protein n=1 Tax=Serratia liquefaciens TaxID=614 RepID=UPI003EC6A021
MTVISEDFYHLVLQKVGEVRGVVLSGAIQQPDYTQVQNRAALIFTLECVLEAHRKKFGTIGSPLKGKAAMEHLILQKYKWPLSEIKNLSLQDIILALQEELSVAAQSENVMKMVAFFGAHSARKVYPTIIDEEWDPELYDKLPEQRRW